MTESNRCGTEGTAPLTNPRLAKPLAGRLRQERKENRMCLVGRAAVRLTFGLAAFLGLLIALAGSRPVHAQGPAAAGATMIVDADAQSPGIQDKLTVPLGSTFVVAIEGSGSVEAAGYQWELSWRDGLLDYVAHEENTGATGATLCAPEGGGPAGRNTEAPAGTEWIGLGAGCIVTSGALKLPAPLVTLTLKCVGEGTSAVHLVTLTADGGGEDPAFGATFYAPGGSVIPTSYVDATVTCGSDADSAQAPGESTSSSVAPAPAVEPTVPDVPQASTEDDRGAAPSSISPRQAEIPASGFGEVRSTTTQGFYWWLGGLCLLASVALTVGVRLASRHS